MSRNNRVRIKDVYAKHVDLTKSYQFVMTRDLGDGLPTYVNPLDPATVDNFNDIEVTQLSEIYALVDENSHVSTHAESKTLSDFNVNLDKYYLSPVHSSTINRFKKIGFRKLISDNPKQLVSEMNTQPNAEGKMYTFARIMFVSLKNSPSSNKKPLSGAPVMHALENRRSSCYADVTVTALFMHNDYDNIFFAEEKNGELRDFQVELARVRDYVRGTADSPKNLNKLRSLAMKALKPAVNFGCNKHQEDKEFLTSLLSHRFPGSTGAVITRYKLGSTDEDAPGDQWVHTSKTVDVMASVLHNVDWRYVEDEDYNTITSFAVLEEMSDLGPKESDWLKDVAGIPTYRYMYERLVYNPRADVAIIHLNRAGNDVNDMPTKIDRPIKLEEQWVHKRGVLNLYAFSVHTGKSIHAGHYLLFFKGSDNEWYLYDDIRASLRIRRVGTFDDVIKHSVDPESNGATFYYRA